jgi:Conjugative relaxosome accessory transposon protein
MSLVGTAIIKKEEGAVKVKTYPPQLANENFFRAIIEGGTPKILQCVPKNGKFLNDQCLDVEEVDYEIAYEDSWKGRIFQRLSDIQNKMNEDEPLSQEEINFVALCDAPVLRFLIVTNAKHEGMNLVEISQLSDWVAQDLLCKSLREVINNIRTYAFQLKTSKYYSGDDLKPYLKQLDSLFQIINQYEAKNANSMRKHLKLNALLDVIEEKMRSEILL